MSDWTKIEKGKEDWNRVDRTDVGWFKGGWFFDWFGRTLREVWTKVERKKEDWNRVNRE